VTNYIKNKWSEICGDKHSSEVVHRVALSLALRIIGAGVGFAFNVAVARLLGASDAGVFFLALAVTTVGSVIGRLGLDNSLLRFVSTSAAAADWGRVRGVYSIGLRWAILASSGIAAGLFFMAPWLANNLFIKENIAEPLRWMSLSIVPFTMLNLTAESFKGLKQIGKAMFVQGIGLPIVALCLIYPLVGIFGVNGAVWAYSIATVVIAALSIWLWNKATVLHKDAGVFSYKKLWDSCSHLAVAGVLNRAVLPWAPIFFLGIWEPVAEVGVFSAANRTVMLITLLLFSVNNVVAPKFSELYVKNDIASLERVAQLMTKVVLFGTAPIFLALIFFSKEIMGVFGESFRNGGGILVVLSIGQLVNAATGSVGILLIATGNERGYQRITVYSAFILIVLSLIMVPSIGAMGAAIAVSIAVAVNNIGATWMVYRKLRVVIFPGLKNLLRKHE